MSKNDRVGFAITIISVGAVMWLFITWSVSSRQDADRMIYSKGYCAASHGTWSTDHTICTRDNQIIDIPQKGLDNL
jgi:hypothetical protein